MNVCIICHAQWEIPFEFFSLVLNFLSTISFSDLVDKLHDELNIKDENEEGDLLFSLCLDLDFISSLFLEPFCYV